MVAHASSQIKGRLLTPIAFFLCLASFAYLAGFYWDSRHDLQQEFEQKVQKTQLTLQALVDNHAKNLAAAIDVIANNEAFLTAYQTRDRRATLAHIKPLFDRFRSDYRTSQLFVFDPDRNVFLRAHFAEQYGDTVARTTLQAAVRSDKLSYGVELGINGDVVLRAVAPLRHNGSLLGYIEIGEDVSDLIAEARSIFGFETFISVDKQYVTKENWERGRQSVGNTAPWNEGSPVIVVGQTLAGTPTAIVDILSSGDVPKHPIEIVTGTGDHDFNIGLIPIQDASERIVGRIAVLEDISAREAATYQQLKYMALVASAAALLIFALFYEIIHRTERRLAQERDALQAEHARKDRARLRTIEDLEQGALYDNSTTLPNRSLLLDRLAQQIHVAQRSKQSFAICFVEVSNAQQVTSVFGERLLDQSLQQLAWRFKEGLRKSDTAARYGNEQFIIVLPSVNLELAVAIADKLLELANSPFEIGDAELELNLVIGIALYPYHGQDVETLLRRAEGAKRSAIERHAPYDVFDSRKDSAREQQASLLSDLRRAIDNDELQLHYFPRVDIASSRINGVEALLRWKHHEQGAVPPEELIPLAESSGVIRLLTRWVLNRALRQQASWRRSGMDMVLSINISAVNLLDKQFPDQLRLLLERWDVPASSIALELTEQSVTSDPRRAIAAITTLHELGCAIIIDDVGVGNSALAYLKSMPVSEIKIDQKIIYTLPENKNNLAFVRSTIDLAHSLGIGVVAEGVKNKGIWDALVQMRCDMAQGYHICQPTTSSALECWLVNSKYGLDKKGAVCAVRVEN